MNTILILKIHIILFIFTLFSSCMYDIPIQPQDELEELEHKKFENDIFSLEIIRESRQVVLTQEYPWENLALLYFNVINKDSTWEMWYNSVAFSNNIYDFGSVCYAKSDNGLVWKKELRKSYINNNETLSNIIQLPNETKITEQFIFYDTSKQLYYMICSLYRNGKTTTNILESKEGTTWINKKQLYGINYDTQFSIIGNDINYDIYQRVWVNGLRAIGKSVMDKSFNIIQSPKVILISNDTDFPHIYNNAASNLGNLILFFPTLYNSINDKIKIAFGYDYKGEIHLTDFNITSDLFYNEKVKWGIVSPGLVPTGELNTYWMYYYGINNSHEIVRLSDNNVSKYYRIKIRIIQKNET